MLALGFLWGITASGGELRFGGTPPPTSKNFYKVRQSEPRWTKNLHDIGLSKDVLNIVTATLDARPRLAQSFGELAAALRADEIVPILGRVSETIAKQVGVISSQDGAQTEGTGGVSSGYAGVGSAEVQEHSLANVQALLEGLIFVRPHVGRPSPIPWAQDETLQQLTKDFEAGHDEARSRGELAPSRNSYTPSFQEITEALARHPESAQSYLSLLKSSGSGHGVSLPVLNKLVAKHGTGEFLTTLLDDFAVLTDGTVFGMDELASRIANAYPDLFRMNWGRGFELKVAAWLRGRPWEGVRIHLNETISAHEADASLFYVPEVNATKPGAPQTTPADGSGGAVSPAKKYRGIRLGIIESKGLDNPSPSAGSIELKITNGFSQVYGHFSQTRVGGALFLPETYDGIELALARVLKKNPGLATTPIQLMAFSSIDSNEAFRIGDHWPAVLRPDHPSEPKDTFTIHARKLKGMLDGVAPLLSRK